MGKSTKPTKWFKAVKKAFRSPSKERPSLKDQDVDVDEKLLTKQDFPPSSYTTPTAHPLPLFEAVTHNTVSEPHGPQGLPMSPDPAMADKVPAEIDDPEHHRLPNGNHGYGGENHEGGGDVKQLGEDDKAMTRIQQRFRRSPLALKGLIRLQALVRGQLVRRQAATTLRTMEAIVRVQALYRGRRVRMSKEGCAVKSRVSRIQRLSSRSNNKGGVRREQFPEMEKGTSGAEHEANKRKRRTAYLLTQQLKRSTPNRSSSFIDCDPDQPHEGWAWLELWTNAKAWESRQHQQQQHSHESKLDPKDYIEIIPGRSRRTSEYTAVKEVDKVKLYHDTNSNSNSNSKAPSLDGANPMSLEGALRGLEQGGRQGFLSSKKSPSPHLTTPSPAESEDGVEGVGVGAGGGGGGEVIHDEIPPSPRASEASVQMDEDPSLAMAMEHLVLPQAANGSPTPSDSFSTSNDVHQPACHGAEEAANGGEPICDDENGGDITMNGVHQENGDGNKSRVKDESPPNAASKKTKCRYMAATESAKAKFRSSSNPRSRGSTPEAPESPAQVAPKQRNSIGSGKQVISKAVDSPGKTPVVFGTRKTAGTAVQNRRTPSPKTVGASKEKPRQSVDGSHGGVSPARRNSVSGGEDKRWKTEALWNRF